MYKCKICGREFKKEKYYKIHESNCKGYEYCQNPECGKLLTKPYQIKFCSSRCSGKIANKGRVMSEETKIKISRSLGGTRKNFNKRVCLNCGIKIENPKFCSIFCQHEYYYKKKVIDWLSEPEKYTRSRNFMKKWLIEQKGEKCHRCGWCEVNSYTNKIPLELHHRDGNWKNNIPSNLDIVCGSCHSLTKTYRIGNIGHGRGNKKNKIPINTEDL